MSERDRYEACVPSPRPSWPSRKGAAFTVSELVIALLGA
jgi:hypothetical protein